ncbi:MAG: hypothetical protein OEY56_13120 [Cyclobacteriaceae bacterium]|nr:hypothetical protein [Cyclobacteriaceae bacterium]
MRIDQALESAIKNVPKAVAAGAVDMESGMLLGIKTTASHPQEVFDLLAAATRDMYEGDNVVQIENLFKKARGVKSEEHYFREIVVFSKNLLHYFSRVKSQEKIVFAVICSVDANIGMTLVKGREIAGAIEM